MSTTDLEPLRFSRLKHMSKSAAHYQENRGADTGSMRKGSGLHSYMLGNREKVVIYRDGVRNEKHAKYQAFLEKHPGAHVLSPSEAVDVEGMRKSLEKHGRAMQLLDGVQENRITWTMSGRECAGTPDVVHLHNGCPRTLVELKTGQSAAPDLFKWQAKKLGYNCQLAWYAHGLTLSLDYRPVAITEAYIVAVESSPPYPVTVFRVTERMLARGARAWRVWFEQLLVCERANHFPAYTEADVDWDDEETELEWDEETEAAQ